jgi:hypothetical protein
MEWIYLTWLSAISNHSPFTKEGRAAFKLTSLYVKNHFEAIGY